jgi:hypothetical protein
VKKTVKRLSSVLLSVVVLLVLTTVVSASSPATVYVTYLLSFYGPEDTFTFEVEKAQGAGDLTVDTWDCCIPGDHWRVDLIPKQPADAGDKVTGIGDGNTVTYSGAATSHPWVRGIVVVSYESGVDIWGAGMCVRFQYTKKPGVIINPPPGATVNSPFCP